MPVSKTSAAASRHLLVMPRPGHGCLRCTYVVRWGMEKSKRPGPVLFGDRYLLWPPVLDEEGSAFVGPTVDAFGYRWGLRIAAGRFTWFWFHLITTNGRPCDRVAGDFPWEATFFRSSRGISGASACLVERTEMRMGVRCADCGLRFHLPGVDPDRHRDCIPL